MKVTRTRNSSTRRRRAPSRALIGAAAAALALGAAGSAAALDGPVILGGDNFPNQGSADVGGNLLTGWLAMQRSVEYVAPKVGRANDNSVAAIGVQGPNAAMSDNTGAAIGRAAAAAGLTTSFYEGPAAITEFFLNLRKGDAKPRVIWIAGNQGVNRLDSAELAVLNANADAVAMFVAGGGGLIAHGDETVYGTPSAPGWLATLVPGLEAYCCGGIGLALTPEGQVALPALAPGDIGSSVWRNGFRGNLGGLGVLATATGSFEDPPANTIPQKVLLGGGTAWAGLAPADVTMRVSAPRKVDRGDTFSYRVVLINNGPNLASGVRVTTALPRGFTYRGAGSSRGTCVGGQTPSCLVGEIGVGRVAVVTFFAKAVSAGTRAARINLSTDTPDATTEDRQVSPATTAAMTRLRVRALAPTSARAGSLIRVRLAVTNIGRRSAKGVILRSPIVRGFALPRRPSGARVERRAAIWELGNIGPRRTRVVVFQLRVGTGTRGRWCIPGLARARNANYTSARACIRVSR